MMLANSIEDRYCILELIRTDLVQAGILKESQSLNYFKLCGLFIRKRICRIQTFIRFRKSHSLFSLIARICLSYNFIEIGADTKIGRYFFLPHPRCIIIANNVIIGEHVHVGQYVTIGGNFNYARISPKNEIQKLPVIGDNVVFSPGAVVGGPINIGGSVIVGANAVVTKDIPGNKIVTGINHVSIRNIIVPPECNMFEFIT